MSEEKDTIHGPDYPVSAEAEGIKIKTEKMAIDKLYHCVFKGKVFLFYKDDQSLLHCYEVDDPSAINEISENPAELESILKKYAVLDKEK